MVQTQVFNDSESLEQPKVKTQPSFERTSTIYHPLDLNNNDEFLLYDTKQLDDNKGDPFDLILIDLKNTDMNEIKCVKKNINSKEEEEDIEYVAISYHYNGELKDQPFKTPNHTAHITSIDIKHLDVLLYYIKNETDLKNIRYVWLDAISLDQQQKNDILKRSEIYKRATYILAVPDLNRAYLKQNPANRIVLRLIKKYKTIIYDELLNHHQQDHLSFMHRFKKWKGKNDLKKIYQFLAYLLYDWSNNPMVINEYHIANEKGIPLKYMFISLLIGSPIMKADTFFLYHFSNDDHPPSQQILERSKYFIWKYKSRDFSRVDYLKKVVDDINFKFIKQHRKRKFHQQQKNKISNSKNNYLLVDNHKKLLHFLDLRLTQRHYLDMILNANTTNQLQQIKLYGVLPTLEKYHYIFENKINNNNNNNKLIDWNINNMTSLRLKLYKLLDHKTNLKDDNDYDNNYSDNENIDVNLWDTARLLYACSQNNQKAVVLPSFASYDSGNVYLPEINNIEMAHKIYLNILYDYEMKINTNTENVKHYLQQYNVQIGSLYKKNLVSIKFNNNEDGGDHKLSQPYLSVKSNMYFTSKLDCKLFDKSFLTSCSLNDDHHLRLAFIPFYVFNIPDYEDVPPLNGGSGVYLFGNMHQNRWVVININLYTDYLAPYLPYSQDSQDYTFNIY